MTVNFSEDQLRSKEVGKKNDDDDNENSTGRDEPGRNTGGGAQGFLSLYR